MATQLRIFLRSTTGDWEREVPLEFAYDRCQRRSAEPGFDFDACVEELKAEPPYWANLGIIDLDFGPAEDVDPSFQLLVDGWPRRVSLKAQLQARAGWRAGAGCGPLRWQRRMRAVHPLPPAACRGRVLEWPRDAAHRHCLPHIGAQGCLAAGCRAEPLGLVPACCLQDALAGSPAEPEGPGAPPSQPYGAPHTGDRAASAAASMDAAARAAARTQPALLRAFPYFHTVDANKTARIIRWSHRCRRERGLFAPAAGAPGWQAAGLPCQLRHVSGGAAFPDSHHHRSRARAPLTTTPTTGKTR